MDGFKFPCRKVVNQAWLIWALLITVSAVLASCGAPTVLEPIAKPVPVTAPAEPMPASAPAHRTPRLKELPGIQFTIQVGAFSTPERAAARADRLTNEGLDAYYLIDEDGLYKVRFERFDSWKAASQRAYHLQALGRIDDFFIVQPVARHRRVDQRISLRQKIVRTAGRFLGTAYRWGGESINGGFDCSGLTMTVYRLNGLDLPRNSRDQFRAGTPIKRSALKKGDLVFFATGRRRQRVSHVGIYTGGGRFIHAPGQGKSIRTSSLTSAYFSRRFVGARRYF
jgi:hypothetical protein